ncbi:hypothetical protein VNO78_08443 [Psophocarpus tetragonolobus]|uniref:Uncharacterized protein n=1 Tax=Psophocarpus tetragonolobus TaxID=3891 RepID=A0AAN9XSW4_PSOTE
MCHVERANVDPEDCLWAMGNGQWAMFNAIEKWDPSRIARARITWEVDDTTVWGEGWQRLEFGERGEKHLGLVNRSKEQNMSSTEGWSDMGHQRVKDSNNCTGRDALEEGIIDDSEGKLNFEALEQNKGSLVKLNDVKVAARKM